MFLRDETSAGLRGTKEACVDIKFCFRPVGASDVLLYTCNKQMAEREIPPRPGGFGQCRSGSVLQAL